MEASLDARDLALEIVDHRQRDVDRRAPRLGQIESFEQLAAGLAAASELGIEMLSGEIVVDPADGPPRDENTDWTAYGPPAE